MEKEIINDISKDMKLYDKIIIHIFKRKFIYAWDCGRIKILNDRLTKKVKVRVILG